MGNENQDEDDIDIDINIDIEHLGIESYDTGVDLAGLFAVLSQHLYSTPDVAVRELVQNAHDSLTRRRLTDPECPAPRIDVRTDPLARTLEVHDNGSGLTQSEVHEFLATVGVGATRGLREQGLSDDLIGLFGLGFLSAFVVADEVVVTTTSHECPDETWQYRSFDGHRYSLLPAPNAAIGTVVTLMLKPAYVDLASEPMVASVLDRYCRLLALPITLDGSPPINLDCPWREPSPSADDRLGFALEFESRFEPIAALGVETDGGWLAGQLWIQGGTTYGNADNRALSVYVRGMLLAENDIDLLPRWAGFVSGVVESPKLTPTASRETLQKDANYTEAQIVLAEALAAGLAHLASDQPAIWRRVLARHGEALLGAAIADDRLFDLVADHVEVPTSQGTKRVEELVLGRRIHVSLGSERGFEEVLFHARGVPVARGDRYGVLAFLRRYCGNHGLELIEIGTDAGNDALFEPVALDAAAVEWLHAELAGPDETIVPSRFEPTSVPIAVIPDREAELKRRVEDDGLDRAAGRGMAGLARLHTAGIEDRAPTRVHVNLACPTVARLVEMRDHNPAGAIRGATFLRTIKTLMVATDRDRGGGADIQRAFDDALVVIDGFLLEGGPVGDLGEDGAAQ